jgi:hypothetical protein
MELPNKSILKGFEVISKAFVGEAIIEEDGIYKFKKVYKKGLTGAKKDIEGVQARDMFMTPAYATDLLIPFIPKEIKVVLEPACGTGKISRQLRNAGYTVFESDLLSSDPTKVRNFLTDLWYEMPELFSIITNPPFSIKNLFVERCFEYGVPFALLVNADYSQEQINWIERGCEKIIPKARISYITPNVINRVNTGEGTSFRTVDDIPMELLYKYSSAQFHSMWLTYGYNLGKTETFVELPTKERRYNI